MTSWPATPTVLVNSPPAFRELGVGRALSGSPWVNRSRVLSYVLALGCLPATSGQTGLTTIYVAQNLSGPRRSPDLYELKAEPENFRTSS